MNDTAIQIRAEDVSVSRVTSSGPLEVAQLRQQMTLVQEAMRDVMTKDEDYGIIPGTKKPTLLKPGAEKLLVLFRLDPQYEVRETWNGEHVSMTSTCTLWHIGTGQRMGSGMGICSTRESKYAFRNAQRKCPSCGKEAIIKGKAEYGGGYVCFEKKGGCKAKFNEDDPKITNQQLGQVANPEIADQYNTVLKMSNKRSLVAAVLNVTAASQIFTQDLEDTPRREERTRITRTELLSLIPKAERELLPFLGKPNSYTTESLRLDSKKTADLNTLNDRDLEGYYNGLVKKIDEKRAAGPPSHESTVASTHNGPVTNGSLSPSKEDATREQYLEAIPKWEQKLVEAMQPDNMGYSLEELRLRIGNRELDTIDTANLEQYYRHIRNRHQQIVDTAKAAEEAFR